MVLCVKAKLSEAEKVKAYLFEKELFLEGYRYEKDDDYIYFPVKKEFDFDISFVQKDLEEAPKKESLKEVLKDALSDEELELLKKSMDQVGSIAIIEIDEGLESKEQLIAQAVLKRNPSITTVLKKNGGHEGELRLQTYDFIAGEDTRETIVQENGVRLKIDVEGVYYSVRSATERKRVASMVKKGEHVLVMFSGAAPYPCVIAKNTEAEEIVGIELNECGHELGVENLKLNKIDNVVLVQGDVKDVIPEFQKKDVTFDRIIMPLPHTSNDFLDEAFAVAKKGTVIHLYDFEKEGEFEKAAEKVQEGAKRNKKPIKVLDVVASGQHSPRTFRVCVDFAIQ
ncbi:class I SAM-dependent methyltransferase family protein [Candidatus Woesearchaeota archaeon]|nr:class I SAM-dependent methyltransferase family protein [Candidatus Woesearchaeota archaeon]